MVPGSLGGANWPGGALDPETGYLYVQSATAPSVIALVQDPDASEMTTSRAAGHCVCGAAAAPRGCPFSNRRGAPLRRST